MNRIKNLIKLLANARIVYAEAQADVKETYAEMLGTVEGREWLYWKDAAAIAKQQKTAAEAAVRVEGVNVYERTGEKKLPYKVQVKEFKGSHMKYNDEIDLREWAFENMRGLLVLDMAKVEAAAEAGLLEGVATVVRCLEPKVAIPSKLEVE